MEHTPDQGDDRPDTDLDTGLGRAVDGVAADARCLADKAQRLLAEGERTSRLMDESQALLDITEERLRDIKQTIVRQVLTARAWQARN